jgi:hypothetical protein
MSAFKTRLRPWIRKPIYLFSDQFFYGHRECLLSSLDVEEDSIIIGQLQHGWTTSEFFSEIEPVFKKNGTPYPTFVWSNRMRAEIASAKFRKGPIYAVGSPWYHLVNRFQLRSLRQESHKEARKLVYFPSHSFPGWLNIDTIRHVKEVSGLAGDLETQVCLYWLDFLDMRIRVQLESQGFQVVCLGFKGSNGSEYPWVNNGNRIMYLPNLFKLLSQAEIVVVDEIGSAFFYAASLGIPVVLTQLETRWKNETLKPNLQEKLNSEKVLRNLGYAGVLKKNQTLDSSIQEIARNELGWNAQDETCFVEAIKDGLVAESSLELKGSTLLGEFRRQVRSISDHMGGYH